MYINIPNTPVMLAVLTQTRVHDWLSLGNIGQPRTWLSEVPDQFSTRLLRYTCHLMNVTNIMVNLPGQAASLHTFSSGYQVYAWVGVYVFGTIS